jgi:hypothetical protein
MYFGNTNLRKGSTDELAPPIILLMFNLNFIYYFYLNFVGKLKCSYLLVVEIAMQHFVVGLLY